MKNYNLFKVKPYRANEFRYDWSKKALERENLSGVLSVARQRNYGFKTPEQAQSHAERTLEDYKLGASVAKARDFDGSVVQYFIGNALKAGLKQDRIIEVVEAALKKAEKETDEATQPLSDQWGEFFREKTSGDDPSWGEQNASRWRGLYESEKERFFSLPLSTFMEVGTGRDAIRKLFKRNKSGWQAYNTARAVLSTIRLFLLWIEGRNPDLLVESRIKSMTRIDTVVPKGLKKEQENFAATPEMAQSLLEWSVSSRWNISGAVVLKLFTGARTKLLHQWKWNIVDWDKRTISIPEDQTKLKDTYTFAFDAIPNLECALKWAWEMDGKPDPQTPIAPCCQPKFTNMKRDWINQHREIFAITDKAGNKDATVPIQPGKTHKNMERAAFITYGAKLALNHNDNGFTRDNVALVAEDEHSWESYRDKKRTYEQAEEYFALMEMSNLGKAARG